VTLSTWNLILFYNESPENWGNGKWGFINETLQWKGDMSFVAKFQGYANMLCFSIKRANLKSENE